MKANYTQLSKNYAKERRKVLQDFNKPVGDIELNGMLFVSNKPRKADENRVSEQNRANIGVKTNVFSNPNKLYHSLPQNQAKIATVRNKRGLTLSVLSHNTGVEIESKQSPHVKYVQPEKSIEKSFEKPKYLKNPVKTSETPKISTKKLQAPLTDFQPTKTSNSSSNLHNLWPLITHEDQRGQLPTVLKSFVTGFRNAAALIGPDGYVVNISQLKTKPSGKSKRGEKIPSSFTESNRLSSKNGGGQDLEDTETQKLAKLLEKRQKSDNSGKTANSGENHNSKNSNYSSSQLSKLSKMSQYSENSVEFQRHILQEELVKTYAEEIVERQKTVASVDLIQDIASGTVLMDNFERKNDRENALKNELKNTLDRDNSGLAKKFIKGKLSRDNTGLDRLPDEYGSLKSMNDIDEGGFGNLGESREKGGLEPGKFHLSRDPSEIELRKVKYRVVLSKFYGHSLNFMPVLF